MAFSYFKGLEALGNTSKKIIAAISKFVLTSEDFNNIKVNSIKRVMIVHLNDMQTMLCEKPIYPLQIPTTRSLMKAQPVP
jgi:hypothetical protein